MVAGVKAFFGTNKTKDVSFRKQQLRNVLKLMEENKDRITDALMADLHKVAGIGSVCFPLGSHLACTTHVGAGREGSRGMSKSAIIIPCTT